MTSEKLEFKMEGRPRRSKSVKRMDNRGELIIEVKKRKCCYLLSVFSFLCFFQKPNLMLPKILLKRKSLIHLK